LTTRSVRSATSGYKKNRRNLRKFSAGLIVRKPTFLPKNGISEIFSGMSIPVTTTFTIEGYRIRQYLGVVRGIIVRAPTITQGILGGLKSIVGGQIGAYTEMCEQTRQQAYDLMIDHARAVGANAILGFRYDASDIGSKASGATEVLCYGTAVVIEPEAA